MGNNTFLTIMLMALTTICDGEALLTTQGTHIRLLYFILYGGQVAFISPNMRRDMVPWSITRVTDLLPLNAKLREMQQNTHGLVQRIRTATPNVPHQTPMPHLSNKC